MKKACLFLVGTLLAVTLLSSCQKDDLSTANIETTQDETNEKIQSTDGMTVLGKQLENPYSVKNMRKAMESLAPATRSGVSDSEIQTTHYYVRFHPKTDAELDLLKQDSSLMIYSYPLDYEVEAYGAYYHDPTIPDSLPTYQYASIEVGKEFPHGVESQILEELYIPDDYDDDDASTRSGSSLNEDFIESLVSEAMSITGNEDEIEIETRGRRSKWRPAGRISYYDDVLGKTIGVEGAKVRARRWFTTHSGFVNASGYYSCSGRFRRKANYSFDLERYEFHVKGDGISTNFNGSKRKGNWDYSFSRNINAGEYLAATVFRAAYHYYYKNIGSLRRPPQNSFWKTQMKLKLFNESGTNNAYPARRWLNGNQIKLYTNQSTTTDLYATTIHELAHVAHWKMIVDSSGSNRNRDYNNAEDKMCESWASGVQWYLTKMIYSTYKGRLQGNSNYTNVVIDLIDSHTDYDNNGKSYNEGDKVDGYTMDQLETALIGCNTWIKWRDNIKNKNDNETEKYIDQLFALW